MDSNRRNFLRVVAPAVALPVLAADAVGNAINAKDLVSLKEIKEAFALKDHAYITAETFNRRFELLIDMMFEKNPAVLREGLKQLNETNAKSSYLIDSAVHYPGFPEEPKQIEDAT